MASRLVTELIVKLAEPIAAIIRKGKLTATLLGAIAGAGTGATIGFLETSLLAFGVVLGALVGAAALAATFPKPVHDPASDPLESDESRPLGSIRGSWFAFLTDDHWILTVLHENAVYCALASDDSHCRALLAQLEQGGHPPPRGSGLVFLEDLEYLDSITADDNTLLLVCRPGGHSAPTSVTFMHMGHRDEFIAALEGHYGQRFLRTERAIDPLTAGLNPLIALVACLVVFGGTTWLSSHWSANPPQPPRDKPEGDALVRFLQYAGPQNILLAGLVPTLLCLGWLGYRLLRPPRITRLSRPSAVEPRGE